MSVKIAHWASKGARWEAILDRTNDGYRLSERKHGKDVGASFRPFNLLPLDDDEKTYFFDTSASGRYYAAVYSVIGESFDRSVVRYVGEVVNGRLQCSREQPITHRTTSDLKQWE